MALWNVLSSLKPTGKIANGFLNDNRPENKQRTTNFHFPPVAVQPPTSVRTPPSEVCYNKELLFRTNTSNFSMCSKQTDKLYLSYGISVASMFTAACHRETEANISLVNPTHFPPQWTPLQR